MSLPTPDAIDPWKLPSVSVECVKQLPKLPGVYFMLGMDQIVHYIGQAKNIRARLHAADTRLKQIPGTHIAWMLVENVLERRQFERRLIRRFQPSLNTQGVIPAKPFVSLSLTIPVELYKALDIISDVHGRTILQEAVVLLGEAIKAHSDLYDDVPPSVGASLAAASP